MFGGYRLAIIVVLVVLVVIVIIVLVVILILVLIVLILILVFHGIYPPILFRRSRGITMPAISGFILCPK